MMVKTLVVMFALLFASCAHVEVGPFTPAAQVSRSAGAVFKLETKLASCTAFHIGNGVIISAAHCYDSLSQLVEDKIYIVVKEKEEAKILVKDVEKDILILQIKTIPKIALELEPNPFNNFEADPIITIGFPVYFKPNMTFEVGHFRGLMRVADRNFALIEGTAIGYSGGPIFNLRTGKVVAIQHKLFNNVDKLDPLKPELQQDHWFGRAVLSNEVLDLISKHKIYIGAKSDSQKN